MTRFARGTLRPSARILLATLGSTGRRLLVPWVLAVGAVGLALAGSGRLPGAGRDSAAALWLHLPCFLLAVAGLAAALEAWPLLSRDRGGARLLARLAPPGLDGCAAAAGGSLIALAAALAAAAVAFSAFLSVRGDLPTAPRAHVALELVQRRPILDARQHRLELRGPARDAAREVRLSPMVFWERSRGAAVARLRVTAGGVPLHDAPLEVGGSHETVSVEFPARFLPAVEIEGESDPGLVLYFPPGALEVVLDAPHGATLNAVLAAWSYVGPVALALALATLVRRHVGLPVSMSMGIVCLLTFSLFDRIPNASAVASFAERRWLPAEGFGRAVALWLGIAAAVMLLAMVTGRRRR